MFTMMKRWKNLITSRKRDAEDQSLATLLRLSSEQYQTDDPSTDTQWNLLKNKLVHGKDFADSPHHVPESFRWGRAISFASAVIVIAAIGILWLQRSSIKIYETTKGQHSTVVLQDSTEVILNSLSEISVERRLTDQVRRVSLKGEAMFHVRRNGTPFILTTDIGTVQVLGTEFNVRAREDKMEVAVLSGSVKMSGRRNGIECSMVLTKGQIAFCSKNQFPDAPGSLPFADYPGWMKGRLMFYRSSLSAVCSEIEMQCDIRIRIENPQLRSTTLTGIINSQNAESAVKTLVQLTGTTIRYENGIYNIY